MTSSPKPLGQLKPNFSTHRIQITQETLKESYYRRNLGRVRCIQTRDKTTEPSRDGSPVWTSLSFSNQIPYVVYRDRGNESLVTIFHLKVVIWGKDKNQHKMMKIQQIILKLHRCLLYVVCHYLEPQNAGLVDIKRDLH